MAKKVTAVFALAVTGVVGLHAFYSQTGATADDGYRGDRPSQAPVALAHALPEVARDPMPTIPLANTPAPLAFDVEPTTSLAPPAEGGGEISAPSPTEQPASKVAEKPPAAKKRVVRRQWRGLDGAYAQYPYGDSGARWAWQSQRPSSSRHFPF
jgi:hypothetical protein